jgi:PhnB protein
MSAKPIPDGYHSITPYLVVAGARKMIDFLRDAFGAVERLCHGKPGEQIGHAEVTIGSARIMLADATKEFTPTAAGLHLYVEDVDATYERAVKAGATALRPVANQFYGDRSGVVLDAWGNWWCISTHVEDVSPEEIMRREQSAHG